jgi:hypothetical protein
MPLCLLGKTIDRLALIAYSALGFLEMYGVACPREVTYFAVIEAVRACIYVFSTCENPPLI